MSITHEQFKAVLASMNERQLDYFARLSRRLLADPDFSARLDREGAIVVELLRSENYLALDRWFTRGRLRLVKSDHGGIQ